MVSYSMVRMNPKHPLVGTTGCPTPGLRQIRAPDLDGGPLVRRRYAAVGLDYTVGRTVPP
jgi:hypothetical protein